MIIPNVSLWWGWVVCGDRGFRRTLYFLLSFAVSLKQLYKIVWILLKRYSAIKTVEKKTNKNTPMHIGLYFISFLKKTMLPFKYFNAWTQLSLGEHLASSLGNCWTSVHLPSKMAKRYKWLHKRYIQTTIYTYNV